VRNGSNPASGPSGHWFLGDGMLHGVRLDRGRAAWYRNRYVQTTLLAEGGGLLAAGPPGSPNNQSNVSVFAHGGRLLTSGEVGFPYAIEPADLSTVGPYDFGGRLTTAMTAHPKIDPVTGRMHFFGYGFVPPYLTYHVVEADGTLVRSEEIAVAGPAMIHDFAITDREAVWWELPVLFSLDAAIKGSGFPYAWDPSYGARIGVLPFDQPASAIRWVEIDPCFVFHGANAFRDGDDVVLDVCRLPYVFKDGGDLERSALHRWRVGTGGDALTFRDEQVNDLAMDLPSVDHRATGRPNRHAWFAAIDDDGPYGFEFAGVTRWDNQTGTADRWLPDVHHRAGEAFFVPADESAAEGEGWVLTYVYDRTRDASDLVVLDALDVAAGPVASVHLPTRVPYGFHGWWLPDPA
jgi:carotenoid cleavage dioxygenase